MGIISTLSKPVPKPAFARTLKAFPQTNVAETLGITTQYLNAILNGHRKPGNELAERMRKLTEQVNAERKTA